MYSLYEHELFLNQMSINISAYFKIKTILYAPRRIERTLSEDLAGLL